MKKPRIIFSRNQLLNQSGQAVVEYLLILVITVGLVLAAKNMFTGVNNFMNKYIGDYTICLMEYGELPSMGVSAADQKKHEGDSKCNNKFDSFTLANGRPPGGSSSSSSSGGNSSGGSNAAKSSKSSAADSSKNGDGNESSGLRAGKGRSSVRNKGRSSSPYSSGQISRSGDVGTGDRSGSANKKVRLIETDPEEEFGSGRVKGNRKSARNLGYQKIKYRTIDGGEAEIIDKSSKKQARSPAKSTLSLSRDVANQFGPYKKTFTPPAPEAIIEKKDDDSGFRFGNLLRMLIIIGMIVAIVVFFGSQVMNYTNSKD